jgi:hypothetical protein
MTGLRRFAAAVLLSGATALAQRTVEISEPATVTITDLFKQADVVVVVEILSGDSENYETAVYKAKVLTTFKGAEVGQQLFFGPFIGYEVGGEYVAFLRRAKVGPKVQAHDGPTMTYGPLEAFHLIMYQGYSIMPLRYECAFDGKDPAQSCDYGVRVNTDQVKLPPTVRTFPRTSKDDFVDANRWVRKDVLLRLLATLKR